MKIKSININSIIDKKAVKENYGVALANVSGFATDAFHIQTKYGENTGFKGDFVAVNMLTGEIFESDAVFLPKQFTETLLAKLEANLNAEIEFKVSIKAVESNVSPSGFAWICDAPETQERVARRQLLLDLANSQAKMLALAAPKKAGK